MKKGIVRGLGQQLYQTIEASSPKPFGEMTRLLLSESAFYERAHVLPRTIRQTILGEPIYKIMSNQISFTPGPVQVLRAGTRLERLTLHLELLDLERDLFRLLQSEISR